MYHNELVYASCGNTSIKLLYIWFLVFPGGDAWVGNEEFDVDLAERVHSRHMLRPVGKRGALHAKART
jgi:hypothetical protein